ncbi:hypothetical protein Syun_023608 [Stephania yunnanensis]|uniref:Uncharacterized protein n=1 Tax=Stephania yunnanensis TaxID=152371 RepID=A0AAP0FIW1_9MAGN
MSPPEIRTYVFRRVDLTYDPDLTHGTSQVFRPLHPGWLRSQHVALVKNPRSGVAHPEMYLMEAETGEKATGELD